MHCNGSFQKIEFQHSLPVFSPFLYSGREWFIFPVAVVKFFLLQVKGSGQDLWIQQPDLSHPVLVYGHDCIKESRGAGFQFIIDALPVRLQLVQIFLEKYDMIGIEVVQKIIPYCLGKFIIDLFGGIMFCKDIRDNGIQYIILCSGCSTISTGCAIVLALISKKQDKKIDRL